MKVPTLSFKTGKFSFLWIAAGALLGLGGAAAVACSTPASAPKCDDSKCAPDNKCITEGQETKCRLTCDSDVSPTRSCPSGFYCKTGTNGGPNYCAAGDQRVTWGKLCGAPPDQVSDDVCGPVPGFKCYGRAPNDAQAFCTKADCKTDADCNFPGYYCATVDKAPNVRDRARSFGETVKWCLPRTQCAPCKSDAECSDADGPQACIKDNTGASYCMKTCGANGECKRDHACSDKDGQRVCFPIGGACRGDGTICARCSNDDECASKFCLSDTYTDERSCAAEADTARCEYQRCRVMGGNPVNSDCESNKCIPESASSGICAAAATKEPRDAGAPDADVDGGGADAGVYVAGSCRGTNVPDKAYRLCLELKGKPYCTGRKDLPGGGSYPGCYSRDTAAR